MKGLLTSALCALFASAASAGQWVYDSSVDKMTSKATHAAIISSDNTLSLKFPYAGKNHAAIFVRQQPRDGLNVLLSIDKGQLQCDLDGCAISVRFDDAPPQRWSMSRAADHSSTVLFFNNAQKFVQQLKKARRVLVQATFFQNGDQIMEFSATEPLSWPRK